MARTDPLAHLMPRPRTAQKKARLLELARSILAARKRGVSLADIATGLGNLPKNPIQVSPDYLNDVMTECHGNDWPKADATGRKKSAAAIRDEATGTPPTTGKPEGGVEEESAPVEPTVVSKHAPAGSTASRFHRSKGK